MKDFTCFSFQIKHEECFLTFTFQLQFYYYCILGLWLDSFQDPLYCASLSLENDDLINGSVTNYRIKQPVI